MSLVMMVVATLSADNWPQWRGPQLNGVSARDRAAAEMDSRREHRLEAAAARVERMRRRSSGATRSF